MVRIKSRVGVGSQKVETANKKDIVSKVLNKKGPAVKNLIKKVAPVIKSALQRRYGAALPVGGVFPFTGEPLSDQTIDQLNPQSFIHMMGMMDNQTFHILQGIGSNYLNVEHPMRLITKQALGGDFTFPKKLAKISMRDIVVRAKTPAELSHALHSEWLDMMGGKLSEEMIGGGLFSSLKTLVKKGVSGGRKALKSLASGAAKAVRFVSAGAMGAQMIGKSVSNALMQGIEVANVLSPAIQTVFPSSQGILKAGLGHADAAKELLNRGINIAGDVEAVAKPLIDVLGPLNAPIVQSFEQPVGAGLDDLEKESAAQDPTTSGQFVS